MSNSKKNLLNEGTIRRFMKLAEIDKLSDGFVDGLVVEEVEESIEEAHCGKRDERDEEVEEGMGMKVYGRDDEERDLEEMDHPMARDDEKEMDAAPDADDLDIADAAAGMDLDAEPAADAEPNEALADAVAKLMAVVSDLTGVDIAVDAGEEEEEAELPTDEPMEEGAHEEDELEEGAHEEDELEEEFDQEAFVSEVVARVHARLSKEGREEAAVDQLAERIIQRIKEQSSK